jgi:ferredoxin
MLFFPRCECEKPIIYHLVKDHNLIVNVYRAKVTPEEEGYLVLDVTGTEADIQRAMDFVKTFDVSINYTGKGVTWDQDRCTHCGHCITHCPTGALHIADSATREVVYSETKCIECLACLRVCPFGACEAVF